MKAQKCIYKLQFADKKYTYNPYITFYALDDSKKMLKPSMRF